MFAVLKWKEEAYRPIGRLVGRTIRWEMISLSFENVYYTVGFTYTRWGELLDTGQAKKKKVVNRVMIIYPYIFFFFLRWWVYTKVREGPMQRPGLWLKTTKVKCWWRELVMRRWEGDRRNARRRYQRRCRRRRGWKWPTRRRSLFVTIWARKILQLAEIVSQ